MHTLTVSIQGAANDSTSVELPDDQALPVYVKLKEVLAGTRAARRATAPATSPLPRRPPPPRPRCAPGRRRRRPAG